jgi:hypothetical protein
MMLSRTEWAMRFATTFLDLRDGGVELTALRSWGEELYARQGHLDPAEVARQQFAGDSTATPEPQ